METFLTPYSLEKSCIFLSYNYYLLFFHKLVPVHGRQGDTEEKADHSQLAGNSINKQRCLLVGFVLGGDNTNATF